MSNRRWAGVFLLVCAAWAPLAGVAQWNPPNPVVSFDKQSNGLEIRQKDGVLKVEVDAPDVLHVTYSPLDASSEVRPSDHVVIKKDWPAASFDVTANDKAITLTTSKAEGRSGARIGHAALRGDGWQAVDNRGLPIPEAG